MALAGFMTFGAGHYSFTLFIVPLTEEFGWSRAITGGAISAYFLTAPLALCSGILAARLGMRRLVIFGMAIIGVCLMLVAYVTSYWELYALRILMSIGKVFISVATGVLISYWFSKKYGIALALAMAGWHLGGLGMTPITQMLLNNVSWRETSIMLGVIVLTTTIPIALVILRVVRPGEIGEIVDGHASTKVDQAEAEAEINSENKQAGELFEDVIKSKTFWAIILASLLFYLSNSSIFAHQATYIIELGFSGNLAAKVLSLIAGVAVVGIFAAGMAVDRIPPTYVLRIVMTLFLIGIACLLSIPHINTDLIFYVYILTFGLATGGMDAIWMPLLRKRFGDRGFTHYYGAWYFTLLSGLMLGPVLTGLLYDLTKDYTVAFSAVLVIIIFVLFLTMFIKLPRAIK